MNFSINYNINDYRTDAMRSIRKRLRIQYKRYYFIHAIVIIIFTILIEAGIQADHAHYYFSGSIYFGIGIAIAIQEIFVLWINISGRKQLRKAIETHIADKSLDIYLSFNDELLIYKSDKIYIEYHWAYFEGYLLTEEFIYFVKEDLGNAIFIAIDKFRREEFIELNNFLAANVKVWKNNR